MAPVVVPYDALPARVVRNVVLPEPLGSDVSTRSSATHRTYDGPMTAVVQFDLIRPVTPFSTCAPELTQKVRADG